MMKRLIARHSPQSESLVPLQPTPILGGKPVPEVFYGLRSQIVNPPRTPEGDTVGASDIFSPRRWRTQSAVLLPVSRCCAYSSIRCGRCQVRLIKSGHRERRLACRDRAGQA
jgi:hypothetical protein